MTFEEFRRRFEAAGSIVPQRDLADLALAAVPAMTAKGCEEWLQGVVEWDRKVGADGCAALDVFDDTYGEIDLELTGDAVWSKVVVELPERLLRRLSELGVELEPTLLLPLLVNNAIYDVALELPRHLLLATYRTWAAKGSFTPGLSAYRQQASRKLTVTEVIDVAVLLRNAEEPDPWVVSGWLKENADKVWRYEPQAYVKWIEHMRAMPGSDLDEELVAHIEFGEKRLRALSGDDLPREVLTYLSTLPVTREYHEVATSTLSQVPQAFLRIEKGRVEDLLGRDLGLVEPLLPSHLRQHALPEATDVLRAFLRLEATGGCAPATGCNLLCDALRLQIAGTLVDLSSSNRHRSFLRSVSLKKVLLLCQGRRLSDQKGEILLRISGSDEELQQILDKAARLRDKGQHQLSDALQRKDVEYLRRVIFDSKKDIFSKIRNLRLEPPALPRP